MVTEGGTLTKELKRTISRRLWDTDGTCGDGDAIVGSDMVPYIEGLRDAGIAGAGELLDLIERHGAVILWHEH